MGGKYGEPWRVEEDWTAEFYDANGNRLGQFIYPLRFGQACRARLAVNACAGLSDAALESDVIAVVREALQAAIPGLCDLVGQHSEFLPEEIKARDIQARHLAIAALALLATDTDKGE